MDSLKVFVLVEEEFYKYEGLDYRITGVFSSLDRARRERENMRYRNKCLRELSDIVGDNTSSFREKEYCIFESQLDSHVVTGIDSFINRGGKVEFDKEIIDAEMATRREEALQKQLERKRKEAEDIAKKKKRDEEDLRTFIGHFTPSTKIPEHIHNIGPSVALRTKDPILMDWVHEHLLT